MPQFLPPHRRFVHSRREFLAHCGGGFGGLALSALLAQDSLAFESAGGAGPRSVGPEEASQARPAQLPATA
ncbi:MAG: hypothetical protein ACKOJF_34985, partial [Planctomycetaceae bacterium]